MLQHAEKMKDPIIIVIIEFYQFHLCDGHKWCIEDLNQCDQLFSGSLTKSVYALQS